MGGIARLIRKLPMVKAMAKTPAVKAVQSITKKPETTPAVAAVAKKATFGGGMGNKTVLTSAQGVEDEANVAKTVLGGATKKKKQTNNFGY